MPDDQQSHVPDLENFLQELYSRLDALEAQSPALGLFQDDFLNLITPVSNPTTPTAPTTVFALGFNKEIGVAWQLAKPVGGRTFGVEVRRGTAAAMTDAVSLGEFQGYVLIDNDNNRGWGTSITRYYQVRTVGRSGEATYFSNWTPATPVSGTTLAAGSSNADLQTRMDTFAANVQALHLFPGALSVELSPLSQAISVLSQQVSVLSQKVSVLSSLPAASVTSTEVSAVSAQAASALSQALSVVSVTDAALSAAINVVSNTLSNLTSIHNVLSNRVSANSGTGSATSQEVSAAIAVETSNRISAISGLSIANLPFRFSAAGTSVALSVYAVGSDIYVDQIGGSGGILIRGFGNMQLGDIGNTLNFTTIPGSSQMRVRFPTADWFWDAARWNMNDITIERAGVSAMRVSAASVEITGNLHVSGTLSAPALDTLSNAISAVSQAVSVLSQATSVAQAALSVRIDTQSQSVSVLSQQVSALSQAHSVLSQAVSVADAALSVRIDTQSQAISVLSQQVSTLSQAVSVLSQNLSVVSNVASNALSVANAASNAASVVSQAVSVLSQATSVADAALSVAINVVSNALSNQISIHNVLSNRVSANSGVASATSQEVSVAIAVETSNRISAVSALLPTTPGGRLTLTTVTPVLTAAVTAATVIYYTPYVHQLVPIYDGTVWAMFSVAEISITIDTTNHLSGSNYDLFVVNDAGTRRLGTGAAWTSNTVRAEALARLNGIWTNNASFTFRYSSAATLIVAANRATYVGTFRASANGQTEFSFGGLAAGGTEGKLYLWNTYNRVDTSAQSQDSNNTWTYNSTTWRAADNSTTYRVSFVRGLNEDSFAAWYSAMLAPSVVGSDAVIGVGLDSTTAFSGWTAYNAQTTIIGGVAGYRGVPGLGFHFVQAIEGQATAVNAGNFYGDSNAPSQIQATLRLDGAF